MTEVLKGDFGLPCTLDSLGQRVYKGDWLAGDNKAEHPPIMKVLDITPEGVKIQRIEPAKRVDRAGVEPLSLVDLLSPSCGWVRSKEQPQGLTLDDLQPIPWSPADDELFPPGELFE